EPAEKRKTKGRPSKGDMSSTRRLPSGFEIINILLSERETHSSLPSDQNVSRKSNTKSSNDHSEKSKVRYKYAFSNIYLKFIDNLLVVYLSYV
ncbi:hypothetical protein ABKV19_014811, partial [Rosa sericea]